MARLWSALRQQLEPLLHRLETRLLLVYFLLVLLPIAVITYVSASHNFATIEQNTVTYASQVSDRMLNSLDDYIHDMKQIAIIPAYLDEIQSGLERSNQFYATRASEGGGADPWLEAGLKLSIQREVESSIYFMNNLKKGSSNVYLFDRQGNPYTAVKSGGVRSDLKEVYERWRQLAEPKNGTPVLVSTQAVTSSANSSKQYVFTVVRDIITTSFRSVGLIAVDANISVIEDMVRDLDEATRGTTIIADEGGTVIYDSEKRYLAENLGSAPLLAEARGSAGSYRTSVDGEEQLVIYRQSPDTGWKLLITIPQRHLVEDAVRNRNFSLIAAGVAMAAAMALTVVLILALTKPLRSLVSLMKQVQGGNFEVSFPVRRRDEAGMAGQAFNRMIARTRELIDNIYRIEQRKTEVQLENLQRQINPHFIYNTLESIRMTAVLSDADEVGRMVQLLGEQLRYSLHAGSAAVPAQREWEHLEQYVELMNYRYGGERFRLTLSAEARAADASVMKLIFQPIVENAVLHGYDDSRERLTIEIDSWIEGMDRVVRIRDDGRGMQPEVLARVRAELASAAAPLDEESGGIGLRNVQERLQLRYGPGYGLQLASEPGAGTTVTMRIPQIQAMDAPAEGEKRGEGADA
ncbi:cache domain-containing sensor histidine kinase [Paenibacillus pasadenensis]|uniref:histidine kinase n=1 Tax=Paenibacillus pasadenensis TaxID=217090 RepID=A0A2N5NDE2_9BACL|nr:MULTISPECIES: sensor histidine kinase [Paenibacillus]PLT48338.1 two-component system sensor kinase [Paenibacillus pasadenensis]QGG58177.1 HAMP domain-containing protein [Paenibacillus sp. B01]